MSEITPFVDLDTCCANNLECLIELLTKDARLDELDSGNDAFLATSQLVTHEGLPGLFHLYGDDLGITSYRTFIFACEMTSLATNYRVNMTTPNVLGPGYYDSLMRTKLVFAAQEYANSSIGAMPIINAFAEELAWREDDIHLETVRLVGAYSCMLIDFSLHEAYVKAQAQRLSEALPVVLLDIEQTEENENNSDQA